MLKDREPLPKEYMDKDVRVEKIAQQGLSAVWLFPTLGVLYEELLKEDIDAVKVLFRAFNQWLNEDWGYNYKDTIFAAPYISLCDVDFAVEELKSALDNNARVVCMRPAAVLTGDGYKSPADPLFDPFWNLLNESEFPWLSTLVIVDIHLGLCRRRIWCQFRRRSIIFPIYQSVQY